MPSALESIYQTNQLHAAQMLADILDQYNIPATVPKKTGDLETFNQVMVASEHAVLAKRIAAAFDKHILNASSEDDPDEEPDNEFYFWRDWPTCPKCSATRQTKCQFCHTSGTDFLLADAPPVIVDPDSDEEITQEALQYNLMLLCHTCDEPFEPIFYQQCQWCDHDFGEGYEDDAEVLVNEWTNRTLFVGAGLIFLVVLAMVYAMFAY